jgi:methoxymalonate biosynthesis acyl carrier protein
MDCNQTEIKTKVKSEIEALAACEISDLDAEIFTSGLLDSLNILNIIVFIEKEFSLKINPFDINLDTLGSINRICEYIMSKKVM